MLRRRIRLFLRTWGYHRWPYGSVPHSVVQDRPYLPPCTIAHSRIWRMRKNPIRQPTCAGLFSRWQPGPRPIINGMEPFMTGRPRCRISLGSAEESSMAPLPHVIHAPQMVIRSMRPSMVDPGRTLMAGGGRSSSLKLDHVVHPPRSRLHGSCAWNHHPPL